MPTRVIFRIEQESPSACDVLLDAGVVTLGPVRLSTQETAELEELVERVVALLIKADERSRLV